MSGPPWPHAGSFYSSQVSGTYASAQRGPPRSMHQGHDDLGHFENPRQAQDRYFASTASYASSSKRAEKPNGAILNHNQSLHVSRSPAHSPSFHQGEGHSASANLPSQAVPTRVEPLTGYQAYPTRQQSLSLRSPSSESGRALSDVRPNWSSPNSPPEGRWPDQYGATLAQARAPDPDQTLALLQPPASADRDRARESMASGIISMYGGQWSPSPGQESDRVGAEVTTGRRASATLKRAPARQPSLVQSLYSSGSSSAPPSGALERATSAVTTSSDQAEGTPSIPFNEALLSELALYLKDAVPRSRQAKGFSEHSNAFTGQDVVSTITKALANVSADRRQALDIARSLHQALFFHEIDWSDSLLRDGPGQAFIFFEDEGIPNAFDHASDVPKGVLTSFTGCYSPSCSKLDTDGLSSACYAYSCPRRQKNRLERHGSSVSSFATADTVEEAEAWETSVPSSVVNSLTKKQIKYQNLVFELVQGEIKYLQDLELVEKGFAEPIRHAATHVIAPDRLEQFLDQVLLNMADIREHSRRFLSLLLARQKESFVFHGIGQIILASSLDWAKAYVYYISRFPMADWVLKDEASRNPRLRKVLEDFQRLPEAKRRGFDTFHNRVMPRGLRYDMFLDSIYQALDEDDPDRESVAQARSVIKQQARDANGAVKEVENRVALLEFDRDLLFKHDAVNNLELLDPDRRFFRSGKALRRADGAGFSEWVDVNLVLFDNYLVVTKPRRERDQRYPQPDSPQHGSPSPQPMTMVYPITFYQLGKHQGMVQYFVDSAQMRTQWEQAFQEALTLSTALSHANRVYTLNVLADQTFGAPPAIGSLDTIDGTALQNQTGAPTCSAPLKTSDGQSLVLAGCAEGLFAGFRDRPRSMRQVVHLNGITQCAILPESGFVLVLANKVLIAYALEALIPSGRKADLNGKGPQRLSGQKDVSFFRVGRVGDGRTLVIYAKRSGVKESVFKALEPISPSDRSKSGGGHRFLGFGKSSPEWFRADKEFFMPTQVTSLQFHRSKTMTVPDFPPARHDRAWTMLADRCKDAQTLGMFRLGDSRFLLVFDEFAFHVGRHGEPIEDTFMEWDTKPEQAAFHAGRICLFSPSIVEIRDAFTGRFLQIIPGSQIGLTFDGVGLNVEPADPNDVARRIHLTMRTQSWHVLYELAPITE
ncbi:Rho guanine nucleotide exchange factor [Microbotryomycetes sp. JL221]|nr:Rho guanine nucleotide exchange factor [Microbotryomycetes sp. JL221]